MTSSTSTHLFPKKASIINSKHLYSPSTERLLFTGYSRKVTQQGLLDAALSHHFKELCSLLVSEGTSSMLTVG